MRKPDARATEIIKTAERFGKAATGRAFGLTRARIRQIVNQHTKPFVPWHCLCETCGKEYQRGHCHAGRFCSEACIDTGKHSPKFIAECLRLWNTGLSVRLIAARMEPQSSGLTKNAVIGIADRNDFPARPSPIKRAA